jgi:hypothetical protein
MTKKVEKLLWVDEDLGIAATFNNVRVLEQTIVTWLNCI